MTIWGYLESFACVRYCGASEGGFSSRRGRRCDRTDGLKQVQRAERHSKVRRID